MSEHSDLLAEAGTIQWEREVRGYNRQQVDEYVAWRTGQARDLEAKLSQSLAEIERLRRELAEARDTAGRPAHEEISERVGQILKLADDEAKAQRNRAQEVIAKPRGVLLAAYAAHPELFRHPPTARSVPTEVWINRPWAGSLPVGRRTTE